MSKPLGYTYQGGFIYELGIIGSGIISVIAVLGRSIQENNWEEANCLIIFWWLTRDLTLF